MDDIRVLAGGARESDWTGMSSGDIQEWATTIWESATASTLMLPHVVRYDSPRTIEVPYTKRQTSDWATGTTDATTSGTTNYDVDDIKLTPVKYRTLLQMQRESLALATWSVEADIRKRLAHRCALKLDKLLYSGFDDGTESSDGDFDCAGSSVDTGTNTSVGTALSVDNIVDAIDGIRQNNYVPNTMGLRAEHHADLLKESTFISAAEHGDASVLQSGIIAHFLGLNVFVSENIPEDSSDYTLSFVWDDTAAIVANIPNVFELEPHLYWRTDNVEFCAAIRAVADQLDGNAAATLYGSA